MASRVWVFDNAINSRSCLIDHVPPGRIVLATMLPPHAFNRGRGVRASSQVDETYQGPIARPDGQGSGLR
jgi:hypothetical protein